MVSIRFCLKAQFVLNLRQNCYLAPTLKLLGLQRITLVFSQIYFWNYMLCENSRAAAYVLPQCQQIDTIFVQGDFNFSFVKNCFIITWATFQPQHNFLQLLQWPCFTCCLNFNLFKFKVVWLIKIRILVRIFFINLLKVPLR